MLDNVRGKDKPFTNALIGGFIGGFCAGTRGKCFWHFVVDFVIIAHIRFLIVSSS